VQSSASKQRICHEGTYPITTALFARFVQRSDKFVGALIQNGTVQLQLARIATGIFSRTVEKNSRRNFAFAAADCDGQQLPLSLSSMPFINPDIRWKQRFQHFDRALMLLREALQNGVQPLSMLEKEAI
jgi:hypothetical protein